MKVRYGFLLAAASLVTLPACAHAPAEPTPPREVPRTAQRVMPPPELACPRDQLTSFNGRVVTYARQDSQLRLQIHTEWDTRESVQLALPPAALNAQMRIDGNAFADQDWPRIETAPGVLRKGVRVIAWICSDEHILPVLDWRTLPAP